MAAVMWPCLNLKKASFSDAKRKNRKLHDVMGFENFGYL